MQIIVIDGRDDLLIFLIIMTLKQIHTEIALNAFLKAILIEGHFWHMFLTRFLPNCRT